jgi:hypothetical protein
MLQPIKDLFSSKKFLAALAGILGVGGENFAHSPPWLQYATVILAGVYVAGQALADHGKSAAQVHAGQDVEKIVEVVRKVLAEEQKGS